MHTVGRGLIPQIVSNPFFTFIIELLATNSLAIGRSFWIRWKEGPADGGGIFMQTWY